MVWINQSNLSLAQQSRDRMNWVIIGLSFDIHKQTYSRKRSEAVLQQSVRAGVSAEQLTAYVEICVFMKA